MKTQTAEIKRTPNWYMSTLDKAPSMQHTIVPLNTDSYEKAKNIASNWAARNGRPASIHDTEHCVYAWYWIDQNGRGWDRNVVGGPISF